jgi:lysophospholipase
MDLVDIVENPVPEGAETSEVFASDGIRLRWARWPPVSGKNLGTVCLLPGRAEFIEKYFEVVGELRRRGFGVAALDWRGQGGSQRLLRNPRKSHVDSFSDYDRDLAAFMEHVVLPDCTPPYFALGHSTGGHVLLRNAVRRPGWFERMVLSAPLISLSPHQLPGAFTRRVLEGLCLFGLAEAFVPRGGGSRPLSEVPFDDNPFTSDPVRFARTNAVAATAPHLTVAGPTLGWLVAALASFEWLARPDFATSVAVPVLMIGAGADRVVSNTAIEQLGLRLKTGSHIVLPGARHEILMERDVFREQFWAAFDAFVPGELVFA